MRRLIKAQSLPKPITGPWTLESLRKGELGTPSHGLKVFSCFHCGGGSSMGYKLAGFDVLGGVEIDPQMMGIYRKNFSPRTSFQMPVQDFKNSELGVEHKDLFDLDVLDGSPPCSSFSMAGDREKKWGEKKKFREGQAEQVLDDLFFHFIEVAKWLRPKMVIAENVRGLIQGNARGYVLEIFEAFRNAGYDCQLFLLNASRMGVPQRRERVFFVARRKDLGMPGLKLEFNEAPIGIRDACKGAEPGGKPLSKMALDLWRRTRPGKCMNTAHPKGSWFAHRRPHPLEPMPTVIGGTPSYHWLEPRELSAGEIVRAQTFPDDYDFNGSSAQYVCGMSVPPLMMQRVGLEVARSLLELRRSASE